MFVGSIPAELRAIVHEHTTAWPVDEVFVGCSGNLTVERALEGRFRLHSNDVSLYTGCVASWLAEQPFGMRVADAYADEWGWLTPYLEEPVARVATLMLATRMLAGLHRENPYYERMRRGYRDQWERLHAKTVEKLGRVTLRLEDYFAGDVREYYASVPDDGAVVSFPPFYTGGYEALYKPLGEVFEWDEPDYEVMDSDALHQVLEQMREKRYWFYATDHRLDGRDDELRGIVQPTNRNVPIFVYSSHGTSRTARPRQKTEPVTVPRVRDELGDRMTLAKLSPGQFAALRSQYLDPRIAPGTTDLPLAVLVDGRLAGVCALQMFNQGPRGNSQNAVYLQSDFAVSPTAFPRLSKLVVMAALSVEARDLAQRYMARRIRTVTTTAFTDRPVSMKYRGLLKLTKRTELEDQPFRYQLQYAAPAGQWTLAEALATWKEKFGATRQEVAVG